MIRDSLQYRGWRLIEPQMRRKIIVALACNLVVTVLEILGISMVLPILALLIDPQPILQNPFLARIYSASGITEPRSFAGLLLVVMTSLIVLKNLAAVVVNRWQISFLLDAAANVSERMFLQYLRMPYLEYLKRQTGVFTYSTQSLGAIFFSQLVQQTLNIAVETITCVLLLAVLFWANPMATLLAIGVLFVGGIGIYGLTAGKLELIGRALRSSSERCYMLIKETFSAFKELRVLGRGGFFAESFNLAIRQQAQNQIRQASYVMYTRHVLEILLVCTTLAAASYMLATQDVAVAVGQLSLFVAATFRILPSAVRIVTALQTLKTTKAPLELLEEEMANFSTWTMEPPETLRVSPATERLPPGDLEMIDVSYRYVAGTAPVVDRVSLKIPFGSVWGIAGSSGAGKTTIADLMLGILKPDGGRIVYRGQSCEDDPAGWRRLMAHVPQGVAFISGTVRENVALGLPPGDVDDAVVWDCLRRAQLEDRIKIMPAGLDAPIGENGSGLSGGEKQRLGIARALYQRAGILLLDEATSALDVETENRLIDIINELRGSLTVVIIAHRLSTLKGCDQVAFMEGGSIAGCGSFAELYAMNARFRRMVDISGTSPGGQIPDAV